MGSEVINDKEKEREITDAISKWIPLLTGIITLVVAIGNVALNFLNYGYARKAEDFYGIPSRNFVNSIIDDKVMIFVTLCSYCVMLCLPFILKKLYRVKKLGIIESFFYSLVIACVTGPVVLMAIIRIISIFNLGTESSVVLIVTGIIFVLTLIIYIYLFMKDFSNARKEDLEKQENIIKRLFTKFVSFMKELPAKFISFIKELPEFIMVAVLMTVFLAPLIITDARITENPKNKTKYELVTINDGDKGNKRDMAVVSYKNGKAVLMDCTIIRQVTMDGKEIENLLLTKGKYRLIDIEGYQIEYKEFNAVKCE